MSDKLTITEIARLLSDKTNIDDKICLNFVRKLFEELAREVADEGTASITNFGRFDVHDIDARPGRNPQTGENITIPAHKRVVFSAYKALGEKVNSEFEHLGIKLLEEEHGSEKDTAQNERNQQPDRVVPPKTGGETAPGAPPKNSKSVFSAMVFLILILAVAAAWYFYPIDESEQADRISSAEAGKSELHISPGKQNEDEPKNTNKAERQAHANPVKDDETNIKESTEGSVRAMVDIASSSLQRYTVNKGDWFWVIARKIYGREFIWPLIFEVNKSVADNPDQIYPGSDLILPELEGDVNNLSENDRKKLHTAYLLVAKAYRQNGNIEKAQAYQKRARSF